MDSAHFFRLFRDHAALQAVQEELAAGRRNTLVMVVDDDRVYPRDALETYLYYSELLPGAALCFRGAAIPRSLDWRDAKMIYASELREPRRAAVITGCGSYLIQPRFFDESLWDYSNAPNCLDATIECRDPPKFFARCFGRAYLSKVRLA